MPLFIEFGSGAMSKGDVSRILSYPHHVSIIPEISTKRIFPSPPSISGRQRFNRDRSCSEFVQAFYKGAWIVEPPHWMVGQARKASHLGYLHFSYNPPIGWAEKVGRFTSLDNEHPSRKGENMLLFVIYIYIHIHSVYTYPRQHV